MTSPQMRRLCQALAKDAPPARLSWVHYIINARVRRHAAAAKAIANCAPGQSGSTGFSHCLLLRKQRNPRRCPCSSPSPCGPYRSGRHR